MLTGTQLKLYTRSAGQSICKTRPNTPMVTRPCLLKSINEGPPKVETVERASERVPPELRVVSLHLEDETFNAVHKKIIRSPRRMPLYCTHLKRVRQNTHRDGAQYNDEFLVKGVEVRIDNDRDRATDGTDSERKRVCEAGGLDSRDEYKLVENGIQIQLTDCCQCVCDLFNSGFQFSHDLREFNFVSVNDCDNEVASRQQRMRETPRQASTTEAENVLDPNILKVIRVTMNTKKSK